MNKQKSNKAWRIGWPIIAIGWLVLSVLEFIDDEGRIFRGVIFLVFAILWAVIYFNELKKFKKEELKNTYCGALSQEGGIAMKDFTEKSLKGGMRATGLSAASLLCVCLAQISASRHGASSDLVLYLALGSLLCSIILFIYYLTKYRKLKNN